MAKSSSQAVAVLGAGITGLTAALRLTQKGHHVRVFEATARVGGAIRTESAGGWLIECGPNSILADEKVRSLVAELGLAPECVPANPHARKRFIVRNGKPLAAPLSPPALLRTRLFSARTKFRIAGELLRRRRMRHDDASLEDFVREHFGQEAVDYALNPFVGGIYAGNPQRLSTQHAFPRLWAAEQQHGSLLRAQIAAAKSGAARPGIISFRRGLQELPDRLASRLSAGALELNARVTALEPGMVSRWRVRWNWHETDKTESFDAVISALPGPALTELQIGQTHAQPLHSLAAIEHAPVASLFLGFHRDHIAHPLDGFGMLVPEVERRAVLGVLFSSSLFPGRAPVDHVALTVLVGGTRNPDLARVPAGELLARVERDLRELLGVRGRPVFQHHTFWPRAIPQYELGYEQHLTTIREIERTHPGLWIGGQIRDGISVPACLAAGERLAGQMT